MKTSKSPFKISSRKGKWVLYCKVHDTHEISGTLQEAMKTLTVHWNWFHNGKLILIPSSDGSRNIKHFKIS